MTVFGPFNRTPFNRSFRAGIPASAQARLEGQSRVAVQATLVSKIDAILSSSSHMLVVSASNLKNVLSSTSSIQANAEAFYPSTPSLASLDSTSSLEANGIMAKLAQTTLSSQTLGQQHGWLVYKGEALLSSSMDDEFQSVIYRSISSVLPAVSGIYASAVSYYDVGINEPRYIRGRFGYALIVEEGTTNLIPSAQAFEFKTEWTSPTLDGTYTLSVRDGTGRIQISGAYTGSVSPGEYVTFSVTSGTITLTPEDGIPKLVQLEAKPYPTSFIDGTRANESASINTKDFVNPDEGTIDIWKKEDGRWVLITIVWKNGTATVYRDRVQESTISNYQPPTPVWNLEYGIYDEIRFSSVARSPEEIAAYDLENPLPTDDKTTVKYDFNKRLDAGIGHPYTTILGDLNITGPLPFNITLGPHGILAVDKDGYHTFSIDGEGNAMFAGELVAARGTFVGELQAATGSFTGEITATRAYFTGSINAQNATITGTLTGSAATLQSVDIRNANIINANIQQATITGTLVGVDGTFTGELLAATGTFAGHILTRYLEIGNAFADLGDYAIRIAAGFSPTLGPRWIELTSNQFMEFTIQRYEPWTGNKTIPRIDIEANYVGISGEVDTLRMSTGYLSVSDTITANLAQIRSVLNAPNIVSSSLRTNIISGYTDWNIIYLGDPLDTSASIDTTSGPLRLKYNSSNYVRITNSSVDFYFNGNMVHAFRSNGSKVGGSIVDPETGKRWGMSPIDSPQAPIEYFILDVEVTEDGTEVLLDERFVKAVAGKYSVFTNATHTPIKIIKQKDRFVIKGPKQTVDIRVVGFRYDSADQFWVDMVEYEEELGQPEEVINLDTESRD